MRTWRGGSRIALGLVGSLLALSLGPPAEAGQVGRELEEVLQTLQPGEQVAVIVALADTVDAERFRGRGRGGARGELIRALKAKRDTSQLPVKQLLESRGVAGAVSLWAINAIAVSAAPEVVRELAGLPEVRSVRLDASLEAPWETTGTASVPEWNLEAIRAPELWAMGHMGDGVVVASMDTGVDANHPDLSSSWRGGANSWFDPNDEHQTPYDADGHGTQAMGLLVGGDAGGSAIGVAPDARWITAKIFDDAGEATFSGIHQAFQWLLDPDGNPDNDDAPDVVNSSWALPETLDQCFTEFEPDIELLEAAGIAVVFSAGNQGPWPSSSVSPSNNAGVIATGGVDEALEVASFSGRGPGACDGGVYPEMVAPAVNVRTSDLTFGGLFPNSYVSVTGTSFGAPHVSGGIALLLGAFPEASVDDAKWALETAALDLGASGPDDDYGHGLIDLVAAHAALSEVPTCKDGDADGFFAEEGCGTPLDCDDQDPTINPAACDVKRDGIDQDCDGVDRRRGRPCKVGGENPSHCGLGVELALLLPALLWLHRRRGLRSARR